MDDLGPKLGEDPTEGERRSGIRDLQHPPAPPVVAKAGVVGLVRQAEWLRGAGKNPGVVPRWTLYRATPTSSVEAVQPSVTAPIDPVAPSPVGALGADVSGVLTLVAMSAWISVALSARL